MSLQDKIHAATLDNARSWEASRDQFVFCIEYLEISAHRHDADHWVELLEDRFSRLLGEDQEPKEEDNADFVRSLMTVSKHGALAQLFVIDALTKWSKIISESDPAKLDSPMLNGKAWVAVAKEIREKLDTKYGR